MSAEERARLLREKHARKVRPRGGTAKPTGRRIARQVIAIERAFGCRCVVEVTITPEGLVAAHAPDCPRLSEALRLAWHVPVVDGVAEWRASTVSLRRS